MRCKILTIAFTLFSLITFGQTKADSLFAKGGQLYEEKDIVGAIKCYKEVEEKYKNFKYYNQCVYNLAYSYDNADSIEQALIWYEKIRASNVKDNDRIGGRGIFEPYSNYKHYATFNIANIEYNRDNFEKALNYYQECLTKFPYYNESGTDIRITKNRLKIYIMDCYVKLKKFEDALLTIVPEALDSYESSNYNSVVKSALTLIQNNFSKKEIAAELENAFLTIQVNSNFGFTFTWRNRNLDLFPYVYDNRKDKEKFVGQIKQTDFWKKLIDL